MIPRTDVWLTPEKNYTESCKRWNIKPVLDAASHKQYKKCEHCITAEQNALTTPWLVDDNPVPVWCNPPNSLLNEFILRALDQWLTYGMPILLFVPMQALSNIPVKAKLWEPFIRRWIVRIEPIAPRVSFIRERDPSQPALDHVEAKPRKIGNTAQAYTDVFFPLLDDPTKRRDMRALSIR